MVFHSTLSISSNASTRTSHVASARGISVLKSTLVYGRDVSCRLCYSILLSIGFFIAQ